MKHIKLSIIIFFLFIDIQNGFGQTDFSVLNYWEYYSDAENLLYKQQCDISFKLLDERKIEIAKLKTAEDWQKRQQFVREKLNKVIGPFPAKTPLNPLITGKLKGDGFSVEKLVFESIPGYKVTAAFFIPDGKKRNLPVIIFCSGHSDLGFRSDVYQLMILNLVKKGFAVFAFDPVGQGERLQYFDPEQGKSRFGPTQEHSYPGAQLFINGSSAAKYMIWDGIRSVDYLLTRKEIDPERIGITGRSGGGTQSAYIAAFDERINVLAPECYITSFEYLLKSMGPQDAEQNFFHGLKEGIDLGDLLEVRAPKPALMITTTRDIFSIQGARETFDEVRRTYETFGTLQNIQMVEDDAGHQSTKKNREAMYAFFQEHLENPGSGEDQEVELFPVKDLYVTETGQLATSLGSTFLFDLNLEPSQANQKQLEDQREDAETFLADVRVKAEELSGINANIIPGKLVFSGRTAVDDYFMEKYIIEFPGEYVLPFVCLKPKTTARNLVLYLDDLKDKSNEELIKTPIQLVKAGNVVIFPDLPGYGALGPGYLEGDAYFNGTSYNQWFAGVLNGKSMVAIHVESIQALLSHCDSSLGFLDLKLIGMSNGPFNSSLLHAAIFEPGFDEIIMINPLLSINSLAINRTYKPSFIPFTVAGGLVHYDLVDLMAALAPIKITAVNPLNHLGEIVDSVQADETYSYVKRRFKSMDLERNFKVIVDKSDQSLNDILPE